MVMVLEDVALEDEVQEDEVQEGEVQEDEVQEEVALKQKSPLNAGLDKPIKTY